MTKKFCCKHPLRGRSTYSKKRKGEIADRYGQFRVGEQITHDRIAGRQLWAIDRKGSSKGAK